MKPFIIIVEGPQGVGKTTLTNWLRDSYPYTELMRLTGSAPISSQNKRADIGYDYHMGAMKRCRQLTQNLGCFNVVMDRSYITELVYADLYKGYASLPSHVTNYCEELNSLALTSNVIILSMRGTEDFFKESLKRDKPNYQDVQFGIETSIKQQDKYYDIMVAMKDRFLSKNVEIATLFISPHVSIESVQDTVTKYLKDRGIERR